MDRKYIIYLSTNLVDGMVYKGTHFNRKIDPYEFDGYLGSGVELLKAIKEFGRKNFKRETLFVFNTKEEAKAKEKEEIPIEFVNDPNTYNKTIGGGDWPVMFGSSNHMFGKHHTEETKKRIGEANGNPLSEEHKESISIGLHNHYNSPKGEETRRKISKNHKNQWGKNNHMWGKSPSEETRRKISEANLGENNCWYGKHFSEEHKRHLSESRKGIRHSLETRQKMSESRRGRDNGMFGKFHTEESKKLMSEKKCEYYNTVEGKKTSRKLSIRNSLALEVINQRREDIKNIPKVWGYKIRLSEKWKISDTCVGKFIKRYAQDLV